jgi:CheY-like chemotaxis protein
MTILNEILDLSKIEAGKMELEHRPFDLAQAVAAVLKPFEYEAGRKGISLALDMGGDAPAWVVGDSTRFKQVLRNLTGNAMKFTAEGGVTIRIRAGAKPGALDFEVEDTGPGIPEEARGRIFQSFSQADDSTTRKYGGTGLGLAICKQIVELMGGTIGFRGRAGGAGTVFHFSIPFPAAPAGSGGAGEAEAGRREDAQRDARRKGLARLRVLIVDDHPTNIRVLAGMLEEYGLRPDAAGGGQEALEACARRGYDLVFMDCHMPGMDGLECTRRMKAMAHPEGAAPRIVGVTADVMAGSRERCLAGGMDEVLSKPILGEDLDALLAKVLPSAPEILSARSGEGGDEGAGSGAADTETWVRGSPKAPAAGDPDGAAPGPDWVDAGRVRMIRQTLLKQGPEAWDATLANFQAEAAQQFQAARESLESGERVAAKEALHALHGLCLTMGLQRMGAACRALEKAMADAGRLEPEWAVSVRDIEASLEPALREIRRLAEVG